MKKLLLLFLLSAAASIPGFSQKKIYSTSATETIFSFANIDDKGKSESAIIRYAPVINLQTLFNADVNTHVGFFMGFAFRNIGYIYDNYKTNTLPEITYKKKFRSYNFGIPAGIKVGNMDKTFFYVGYEVEVPVLYKEKTFDNGDKIDKITGWFSDRQELFQHGPLAGVQFTHGFNIKFKYYVSEFHNQSFTDGAGNKPYAGLKANIFYVSLSIAFKNFQYQSEKKQPEITTWAE
jgi:hypothetical protein